uniref:Lipoprotein n=1 Tax=Aggregicoccus edonensis TaxID=1450165 RepID=A0A3S7UVC1_9BACT|nr:hypothetical protein [Aggregicoccus edonensis]
MRRLLLALGLLLVPLTGLAQAGDTEDVSALQLLDGGLGAPDGGSQGGGGADRDNEEGDDHSGRVVTSCRSTSDCSPRFTCQEGTCRYTGIRQAERVGCMLGPEATLVVMGLTLVGACRRKKKE